MSLDTENLQALRELEIAFGIEVWMTHDIRIN